MSRKSKAAAAIGAREADYLILENQWARVVITTYSTVAGGWVWEVTGDTPGLTGVVSFPTAQYALTYALECLAMYERGALR